MKDNSDSDSDLSFRGESGQEQFGMQPTRGPASTTPAASTASPAPSTAAPLMSASPWTAQTTASQSSVQAPSLTSGLFGGQPQPSLAPGQSEAFIMTNQRVPHLPLAASDWLMSDGILLGLNCKNYGMTTLMTLTAFCLSSAVLCSALLDRSV